MIDKPIFVIDTNILVDYPDIIPAEDGTLEPKDATVDLSDAHIVIPSAVIRELSSFKKETSERGKTARKVLRRLRGISETFAPDMEESYSLNQTAVVGDKCLTVLPVHKQFKECLPFSPSEDDMDGQIILATIAAEFATQGIPIDGEATYAAVNSWTPSGKVTLLTNDNGLAIRANERGIITSRYGYKLPPPYTGRREVYVPKELLDYYYKECQVELDIWYLLVEADRGRDLVANEFLIMRLEGTENKPEPSNDPYFRYIGRYDATKKMVVPLKYASLFPEGIMNEGQAIYAEALINPDFPAVICTGPAGSGKTYMATVYGYNACKNGDYIGVTVVPCASQSRIGALPGTLNEKMDPDVQPLKNALRNYLLKTDKALRNDLKDLREHGAKIPHPKSFELSEEEEEDTRSISQKLRDKINAIWDGRFSNLPVESARGRDFSYEIALYDEFQDQNVTQADTLIKRLGMNGKIVITGDVEQVHAPYLDSGNNGLVYATQLFYNNPMVAHVNFTEEEVIRHPLVKIVAEQQKLAKVNRGVTD